MIFLKVPWIISLHQLALTRGGLEGLEGVRDVGALESAVNAARMRHTYERGCDAADLAGTLLERLVQTHPFLDGNKRTATLAALTFLRINGFRYNATDASDLEFEELVVGVACRTANAHAVAEFFRRNHCG